jgi:outer membrane protein assembly factor BamB
MSMRNAVRAVAVSILILAVTAGPVAAASWTQFGADGRHRSFNAQETALSAASIGGLAKGYTLRTDGPTSTPIVVAGIGYATAGDNLVSFWARTGVVRWERPTCGHVSGGSTLTPTYMSGQVWVVDVDVFTVFDAVTGDAFCIPYPLNYPIVAAAAGTMYVGHQPAGGDGVVEALNAADGTVRWSTPIGSTFPGYLCVGNGRVFVSTWDGRILALSARDGHIEWATDVGGNPIGPSFSRGIVFTATDYASPTGTRTSVVELAASTGKVIGWTRTPLGGPSAPPAVDGWKMYQVAADAPPGLFAYRISDQGPSWKDYLGGEFGGPVTIANHLIYEAGWDGTYSQRTVLIRDQRTGELLAHLGGLGTSFEVSWNQVTVVNGMILASGTTSDGTPAIRMWHLAA